MSTIEQQLYDKSNPRRLYTDTDLGQFQTAEKALNIDAWTASGSSHNANLIDEFFQAHKELPVIVQNIYRAVEERKSEFIWLTQAQADWYRAAKQNPDLANELANFVAASAQGRPGQLVSDGDFLFENLLSLFNELNSRRESVSVQTFSAAQDRIAHRPGKQLHYVPQPRKTEPTSYHAKNDDGQAFLGNDLVKNHDGSFRSKTYAEQKRDAEAAEVAAAAKAATKPTGPENAWETLCNELLRFGTHSAQANMRELYDRGIQQGKSFRQIHADMNALRATYQRLISTAKY
jgi:hypothetical protein